MNFPKVLQCPTDTCFLVEFNGDQQFQLQTDAINRIMSSIDRSTPAELPVAIICAVGAPSTRKTAYINSVLRLLMSTAQPSREQEVITGFPEPKAIEQNDAHKCDGILLSTPPLVVEDMDGRRAGVMLLDVWNNDIKSEDVYLKLMDFGFNASSIRIFTPTDRSAQISWWIGDYPSISNKQVEPHWLSVINSFSRGHDNDEASGSYLIALNGHGSVRKLLQSTYDADTDALDISSAGFEFIMEQVFSTQHETLGYKVSGLEAHFKRWLDCMNNSPYIPHPAKEEAHVDALAPEMDLDPSDSLTITLSPSQTEANTIAAESQAVSTHKLVEVFTLNVHQAYAESSQLYLSSGEFLQLLSQFHGQSNAAGLSCHPHYERLRKFHESIRDTQEAINTDIAQGSADICAAVESNLDFETDSEVCKAHQCIQDVRINMNLTAYNTATAWTTGLQLQQLHLPKATEIFITKLSTKIKGDVVKCTEQLEQQMKRSQDVIAQHKNTLCQRLQSTVCISEENFENAVKFSRLSLGQAMGKNLRPAFQIAVEKVVERYEQQLRLYNQQACAAEFKFAKKALSSSITFMRDLLNDHFKQYTVMTDRELLDTFTSFCRCATKARCSVTEFPLNDAWEAAWKDLMSSLENSWSQLRRQNQNGIRKWDRELNSAIEKSTILYNQEMDQRMPNFKLPAPDFEMIHSECAQFTLEKFTVSPQVNEKTRSYWKRVLEQSKLEDWKQGYAIINEKRKDPPATAARNYENSLAKVPISLPACHVGIYFGPDVVSLTALVADVDQVPETLEIKPFLAFRSGKALYGDQALETENRAGQLYNIFAILAQLTGSPEPASFKEEINGQKISVTPEVATVLFFREAINQLSGITGMQVQSCTVTHPGLLHGAAITAIKEAIKLAGFSRVTLIPTTASLALSYIHPLLEGRHGDTKKPKQFVTAYHAGEFLEISWLQVRGGKLEVMSLNGCIDLGTELKKGENLTSLTHKWIKKPAPRDLFATVIMIGNKNDTYGVQAALLGELKCGRTQYKDSIEIAKKMAEIEFAESNELSKHQPGEWRRSFPTFKHCTRYHSLWSSGAGKTESTADPNIYEYVHSCRSKGFRISELTSKTRWVHHFILNEDAPGGLACSIFFCQDGSFQVRKPNNQPGLPVHSTGSKLLTIWDQEALKTELESLLRTMEMTVPQPSPEVDNSVEKKEPKVSKEDGSKSQLAELVHRVEKALEKSSTFNGPLYNYINKSVQECHQLLQTPTVNEIHLTKAMKTLKIRSEDLLKESNPK